MARLETQEISGEITLRALPMQSESKVHRTNKICKTTEALLKYLSYEFKECFSSPVWQIWKVQESSRRTNYSHLNHCIQV